jgi:hypothetical protein
LVAPDELHRLVKLAMDTGEATSVEHARRIFLGYRIGVAVGPEVEWSATHQAAVLTFLRLASRVFLGGIDILLPDDVDIPRLISGNQSVAEAIVLAGATRVESLGSDIPSVYIGAIAPNHASTFGVRAVFSGWRAGLVPARAEMPFGFDAECPLSGALAAALAVNEAFLFVRKDTPEAGYRETGISLWRPDALDDWWRAENDGPSLTNLPSRLWLIGLGHLGQAYLWGLSLLPYSRPEEVLLVLQDTDSITPSTVSTSILSDASMTSKMKTRAMAEVLEARGFRTAIVERTFDETQRVRPDEPQLALCGVDNALARKALCGVGFKFVVEAGLGSGAKDFRALRVHTLPITKEPRDLWAHAPESARESMPAAYNDLMARGLDQCGVTLLAGRAVGAPFVGMPAAALALSEILRMLHGGSLFSVHDLDLKSPCHRLSVERRSGLGVPFNPGFVGAYR